MKKVINPCKCETYDRNGNIVMSNAFVKIEFKDGRLSLHGVIGPMSNGDCKGSCGQCTEEIRKGTPTGEWTPEMLEKLCNIWDEWHLNDMHPECEHQRQMGWLTKAKETVTIYHWYLNEEARKQKESAKERAMKALRNGEQFTPDPTETFFANLPTFYETFTPEAPEYYDIHKDFNTKRQKIEHKTLGWMYAPEASKNSITEKAHPDGILSKACPVCGHKYGHGWLKVDVPQDIIDWLFSLPNTTVRPAWV